MDPITLPSLSLGAENSSGRAELSADLQLIQNAINTLASELAGNGGSSPIFSELYYGLGATVYFEMTSGPVDVPNDGTPVLLALDSDLSNESAPSAAVFALDAGRLSVLKDCLVVSLEMSATGTSTGHWFMKPQVSDPDDPENFNDIGALTLDPGTDVYADSFDIGEIKSESVRPLRAGQKLRILAISTEETISVTNASISCGVLFYVP